MTGPLCTSGDLESDSRRHVKSTISDSTFSSNALGWQLMELIIRYARSEGVRQIEGQVLRENVTMLQMCHSSDFKSPTIRRTAR